MAGNGGGGRADLLGERLGRALLLEVGLVLVLMRRRTSLR